MTNFFYLYFTIFKIKINITLKQELQDLVCKNRKNKLCLMILKIVNNSNKANF